MLESKFKQNFCGKLKKMNCTVLQYRQDSTTVKGFPDTIVCLPESLVVFIEFKASKRARFQPLQKEWGKRLTDRGFYYWVVFPENADEVLKEIKELI